MPILLPLPFNSDGQEIRSAQGIDSLPSHKGHLKWGYDFTMDVGSDVLAQANGRVVGFYDQFESTGEPLVPDSGYGNYLTVVYNEGTSDEIFATFAHLSKDSVRFSQESIQQGLASFSQGQIIAASGASSTVTPHLHVQYSKGDPNEPTFSLDNGLYSSPNAGGTGGLIADGNASETNPIRLPVPVGYPTDGVPLYIGDTPYYVLGTTNDDIFEGGINTDDVFNGFGGVDTVVFSSSLNDQTSFLRFGEDVIVIELPDGSMITGEATFTYTDGSTGKVATATLMADAQGYRVEQIASVDGSGTRTVETTAYAASGDVAYALTSVTTADGSAITNTWDFNGDEVVDQIQTITTVANGDGSKTETLINLAGAVAATALLINRTITTTSADGKVVSIQRDSTGVGFV